MDGRGPPLFQCEVDEAAHDAGAVDDDTGDLGSECVADHELTKVPINFPLDGTLP